MVIELLLFEADIFVINGINFFRLGGEDYLYFYPLNGHPFFFYKILPGMRKIYSTMVSDTAIPILRSEDFPCAV